MPAPFAQPRMYEPPTDPSLDGDFVLGSIARLNPAATLPITHNYPGRIHIKPLVYELMVLTKQRGVVRIGDVIKPPQEMLLTEVERQINNGLQIRIIILKARQMGLSTIVEAVIFALSIMYHDFQSLIISHEAESSEHILGITNRYWKTYLFSDFHDEEYGSKKQLAWSDTGSNIVVATARNVGAGRSKTLHALHASEVAFWDHPDTLMTGLRQAIPNSGITLIVLESTANGIGNYYHTTWQDAEAGESEFVPVFYPWFLDPEYDGQHIPQDQQHRYETLGTLSEDERALRAMGVGVSRLLWRRWAFVALCGRSWDKFKQEYPSTAHEAFLTTGRNVFRLPDLQAHYQPMVPEVGVLRRDVRGRVEFVAQHDGWLSVYRHPAPDKNWGVYQLGADPTHTTVGDAACGQVINRRTLEQCAVYSRHIGAIDFGDDLFLLGEWYNTAQIAPEVQGPGFGTVGKLNGMNYPNIYERIATDTTGDLDAAQRFGWQTNTQTKHQAIGWLVSALNQPLVASNGVTYGLVIHHEQTFNEMKNYVTNDKGGFENGRGEPHDDEVMALGIAVATHYALPVLPVWQPDTTLQQKALEVHQAVVKRQPPRAPAPTSTDPRPMSADVVEVLEAARQEQERYAQERQEQGRRRELLAKLERGEAIPDNGNLLEELPEHMTRESE